MGFTGDDNFRIHMKELNYLDIADVLGINMAVCNHKYLIRLINRKIKMKKRCILSPLASQTFVLAYFNKGLKLALNKFDYLFSDSYWVRQAISFLYPSASVDRIRGENMMLSVCR